MHILTKTITVPFFCCIFLVLSTPVVALESTMDEDTLKAIYSFKFGKFTEWPESKLNINKTSLGFCILGKKPFSQSALEAIDGKPLKGKSLKIKLFNSGLLSDDALAECHIMFISQSEKQRIQAIIDKLRYQPILTVSDVKGFSANGGMVTLNKSADRISFEINPSALERAQLSISSKLLELANIVHDSDAGVAP